MSREEWAVHNYDVGPTGYDDSPIYTWDTNFNFETFKTALEDYNDKASTAFITNKESLDEQGANGDFDVPDGM